MTTEHMTTIRDLFSLLNTRVANIEKCIIPLADISKENGECLRIVVDHLKESMTQSMILTHHVENLADRVSRLEHGPPAQQHQQTTLSQKQSLLRPFSGKEPLKTNLKLPRRQRVSSVKK